MKGSLQVKGNNKYYVYVRINGKQKAIPTGIEAVRGNKRKAETKMAEILAALDENPNSINKIGFVDFAKKWLEHEMLQVDENTYLSNKQHVEKHIIPYFDKLKLDLQDVRTSHIEGYYNYKSRSGRLDGKSGGLSRGSIKRHGAILNLIFNWALHDELIRSNPCECAKIPKVQEENNETQIYTAEECKNLLKLIKGSLLHDMVYLTFIYGLRRSELMGLRWVDIDFNNNKLIIRHTAVVNGVVIRKNKTKNKSSCREYPLLDDIKNVLIGINNQQKYYKNLMGNCYNDTGYVFTKEDGTLFYPDYPSKQLQKIIKKNNLPHIRWHDLRHSCVCMLIEKGWQPKDIAEWVGHSDISTTMNIYAHVTLTRKKSLSESLNGVITL